MKISGIAAAIAATVLVMPPAVARTHHYYHHSHSGSHRTHSGVVRRAIPHPHPVAVPNPVVPRGASCAFGFWCDHGIFDDVPVTPPAKHLAPEPAYEPLPLIHRQAKVKHGIDRRQFLAEMRDNPELVFKMAWMVIGEVGRDAPLEARIVQLETAFNRAQARGQSLAHVLLSVTEGADGYYAGIHAPSGGTYGQYAKPNQRELYWFKKFVLAEVIRGSNLSDHGYGPMTGNASADVARHEFNRGIPGYHLPGGDSYFLEGPLTLPFQLLELSDLIGSGIGGIDLPRTNRN